MSRPVAFLLILVFLVLLGVALAQTTPPPNPPPEQGGSALKTVFSYLLNNPTADYHNRLGRYLGSIALGVTYLAWALFLVALIYRMYDIATSDVDASVALYTLARFGFLAMLLTMSNFANIDPAAPITNGNTDTINYGRFSSVAYVGWLKAYDAGKTRFIDNGTALDRFKDAVRDYTAALIKVALFKGIRDVAKLSLRPLRKVEVKPPEPGTPTPTPQPQPQTKPSPLQEGPFERMLAGIIGPIIYFVLAIPLIIYSFAAWGLGFANTMATVLIPIGIVLVAFGNTYPIMRIIGTIFATHVVTYFMPLIFVVGMSLALSVPANIINNMISAADASLNQLLEDVKTVMNEGEQKLDEGMNNNQQNNQNNPNPEDPEKGFTYLGRITAEVGEKITAALENLAVTLIFYLGLILLGIPLILAITVLSFNAAMQLIITAPETIGNLLSGTLGIPRVPGAARGTGVPGVNRRVI